MSQKETFEVKVPKGSPSGHQFRFAGKADQLPGHTAGDVIVQVKVKDHSLFKRLGANSPDLVMRKEISLTEALCGTEFEVLDLETKKKISVHSPPSSGRVVAPDDVYIVRGKGLPRFDGSTRGDMYVKFGVKFPSKLTELSEKEKERLNASIFGGAEAKKTCLSALFDAGTVPAPAPAVREGSFTMEKCHSTEMRRKIDEVFDTRQVRNQPNSGMHVDPQQCQQQ
jgi:DnaJ-class molecular chaperone